MGAPRLRFAGTDSLAAFHVVTSDDDEGRALLDALARAADVLAAYAERLAGESYLPSASDVRIEVPADAGPTLCVVAGGRQAVFVVVGRDTGDATVVFGEGTHGERPRGDGVSVAYRRGAGGAGELAIAGVPFEDPVLVLARICAPASAQR